MNKEEQINLDIKMSKYGYPELSFSSVTKSHTISVELDISRHEALISDFKILDSGSPVELALMLKNMTYELKKLNIDTIIQQVTKEDWNGILKKLDNFILVNENEQYQYLNVKCEIEKFPEGVMRSLGFERSNSVSDFNYQ
jgi:hypothetical protein